MDRDRAYALDIILTADKLEAIVSKHTKQAFMQDELMQSAVLHFLTVIGEASRRLSEAFKNDCRGVDFQKAIALRNIVVHQYDSIDLDIIWKTISESIPLFRASIETCVGEDLRTEPEA